MAHVGGDVLADPAVAAGRRLHEPAVLVAQAHRQPVDLQLAHERRRRAAEAAGDPVAPLRQLGLVHRVVEAGHRHAVDDRRERRRQRRATDLRGRRVGGDQLGMLGLELQQLADQQVEVGVGDLRAVERVVALVVIGDLLAKIRDTGSKIVGVASCMRV